VKQQSDKENGVGEWLARFTAALAVPDSADWSTLFVEQCYWRDFLAFTWNIVTLEGREAIASMAAEQASDIEARAFAADDPGLAMTDENQGWFIFETKTARCRGHVALRDGRAQVLLTTMLELIGFEEPGGERRPAGIEHRAGKGRKPWIEKRQEEERTLGHTEQPYCLIVGGGQNGLQLAARLKRLSVPTLVVDALEKPGDCWRARYRSLYLHDAIFMDHFPYLPFPDHWPLYMSRDQIANWLEIYAKVMEINFWGSTLCTSARYDERAQAWEVVVQKGGETITLRPKQLVLATGLSGAKNIPAIPGAARFKGEQYHSADHKDSKGMTGKHCVVVGSNNSAHDICVDLWEADAQVTMIQRSPTIVVRAETMRAMAKDLPYANPAIPSEFGDLMLAATPFKLRYEAETAMTKYLHEVDANFYDRLEKSGFMLTDGEDGTGFLMAYHRCAAGYYIDVGGSDLIADGEIKLAHGDIAEIAEDGLRMEDGRFIPADLIVYATGYRPMNEWVSRLISPEVERKVGRCWGLGSGTAGDPGPWEGELRNMWKPTAQEGLWFQGGNLMQTRFHSLHLALQIKARMEGLDTPVYRPKVGERSENMASAVQHERVPVQ
jgi:putative flavoprotein involved in K+ transport